MTAPDQKHMTTEEFRAFLNMPVRVDVRDAYGRFAKPCERCFKVAGTQWGGPYQGEWLDDDCAYFADMHETCGGM